MIGLLAAGALIAQAPTLLAGMYHTRQMEVGAALELKADGTYRYMLDYGAVSEASQGHWTATGRAVLLDSEPLARDYMIRIERSDAAFKREELAVSDESLVLRRYDTLFTFYRDDDE